MTQQTYKNPYPYPYNLAHAVLGTRQNCMPADLDDSVEYLLETKLEPRDAFILILRYLRGMSVQEIAAYYGISQCMREIIRKSLRRLRHPNCSKYLRFGCTAIQQGKQRRTKTAVG